MIKDVVLCGECKFWHILDEKQGDLLRGFCFEFGGRTYENEYCFRAEKRVNNKTSTVQQK